MLSFGGSSLSWPEPREGNFIQCDLVIYFALLDGAKFQHAQATSLSKFVFGIKKFSKFYLKGGWNSGIFLRQLCWLCTVNPEEHPQGSFHQS